MRNMGYRIIGLAIFFGAFLICGVPHEAIAGVNLGINLNIGPPPIVAPEPPAMVMVPGTQVYFVPGVQFDVFFCNGFWWSPRGDRWYRAQAYNGPWQIIGHRFVPGPVLHVPHDYRRIYARERHIPFHEWREHSGRGEHRGMRGEHRDYGHGREEHRDYGHER